MASQVGHNLTGVWHGIYSYPSGPSVHFLASLIDAGGSFGGTAHEQVPEHRTALIFSTLSGHRNGYSVAFRKEYASGSGPGYGRVDYRGTLSADGIEIEGEWTIGDALSGRFLMIRPGRAPVSAARKVAAPA